MSQEHRQRSDAASPRFLPLTLCVAAVLLGTAAQASDFRGFQWGASKEEISRQEKLPLHHDLPHELSYWNFELAGVPVGLIYTFEEGRLVKARYLSRHRTPDPEEDYADYRALQRHFDAELGPHAEEIWEWSDGGKHSEAEQTIATVASGRARLVTRWDVEGLDVEMVMIGADGGILRLDVFFSPDEGD